MFDKPQATNVLGLEIDSGILRGTFLSYQRGKPKVESFFHYSIESNPNESGHVKPLYNTQQKQQLEESCQNNLVVTAMSTQNTLIRPLELNVKKIKDIDAVLNFQAEPLMPYPIENAILDRLILAQEKEGSKLTLTAVRKDHLAQHIAMWNSLSVDPEVITTAPFALSLFATTFSAPSTEPFYALYLGISQIFCILIDNGKLIAAQALQADLHKFLDAHAHLSATDFSNTISQLEDGTLTLPSPQNPQLQSAIEELRQAVIRTTFALAKQIKGQEVTSIFITGPGAAIQGLSQELLHSLNKQQMPIQFDESFGMSESEMHIFALPIGAALSALPSGSDQINFRQQEFAYPAPWKRLKATMVAYLALCLGLALALILFSMAYSSYREGEVKKQYLELLDVMNKPYAEFEKEYATKLQIGETTKVEDLTNEAIKARLDYLEKEIQATPQTYPLLPNVPLVSDVLAWISTHPSFVRAKDGENTPSALQIENFNYTMVKRPEPSKKQEKYQVKVELEFSSPTPKQAREFHDALIAPNEIVDPKGEIKWNSNKDKYRTSFYLKDKTTYPSL